jgi:hypothetical protein
MASSDFKGSHALGYPDKGGDRARPSWENDTTCAASSSEQAKAKASTARDASVKAEADRRASDWKQTHRQDA